MDIPKVVSELVRVTKGDIFLSISLRSSNEDPPPPAEPTVHVTVRPRWWWIKKFAACGCVENKFSIEYVLAGRPLYSEPFLFSFRCGKLAKKLPVHKEFRVHKRVLQKYRSIKMQEQISHYKNFELSQFDD